MQQIKGERKPNFLINKNNSNRREDSMKEEGFKWKKLPNQRNRQSNLINFLNSFRIALLRRGNKIRSIKNK